MSALWRNSQPELGERDPLLCLAQEGEKKTILKLFKNWEIIHFLFIVGG